MGLKTKAIYGRTVAPACKYCSFTEGSLKGDTVHCKRKGVKHIDDHCRLFDYDPILRKPPVTPKLFEAKAEDFEL